MVKIFKYQIIVLEGINVDEYLTYGYRQVRGSTFAICVFEEAMNKITNLPRAAFYIINESQKPTFTLKLKQDTLYRKRHE